jgi:hypothetical protein
METANQSTTTIVETRPQRFERALSHVTFKGLKAILDNVTSDRPPLCDRVADAKTFEDLLARLGYSVALVPQIHVQDAYSRLGRQGGIKAVLPYHDIPTHSSMPTLVNFDATLTVTPSGVAFFNKLLIALKAELSKQDQAVP